MNDNGNFLFEFSAVEAIAKAYYIADKWTIPFITKEIFFSALYSMPDTPLYNYFIRNGATDDSIAKARKEIFMLMNGKQMQYLVMPFAIDLSKYQFNGEDGEESEEEKAVQKIIDDIVEEELQNVNEFEKISETEVPSESLFECSDATGIEEAEAIENNLDIVMMDKDIFDMFAKADQIAFEQYGKKSIAISDLIAAFAELHPDYYDMVVDKILPNRRKEVEGDNYIDFNLPVELAGFLTVMNKMFSKKSKECHILGRDEETKQLIKILMKQTKRNVVLVGSPGVGKTALVEKLVWMIVTGNCPTRFKDKIVLSLDVNAIVAGTQYRGSAEERFKKLIDFLKSNPDCILFIDEIHLLLGAGACREGDLDLANALKPLLARGDTMVIGATTFEEYENYFSRDGALKRRFEKIIVKEPRTSEVIDMIQNQVKRLEKTHGVKISNELIREVVNKASCFDFETCNPDRSLDLLDKVMVSAELEERKEVTMEDVLGNFNIYFKKFEKMSPKLKKSTAYHEAGHYIVMKFSDELVEYEILAVSIYPAENYLGVNVYDIDPEATASGSFEYYIQRIGSLLAGRIAEEKCSKTYTSGASSDLVKATKIASNVVTKYALDGETSKFRVYNGPEGDLPTYSKDTISEIDGRINSVLVKAEEYAQRVLSEKKEYLEILVKALEEKGMLTEEEIEQLFKEFDATKKSKIMTVTY